MPSVDKPQILDGDTVRQMNDVEFEQYELDQAEAKKQSKVDATRAKLKQATLDKLGLTADEISALLS
ncbi:hypothetical protein UFOVP740_12 [uncultured Caudovirales phage]|uniref:Uncharacterized protein n=1 Tax=uncultured Caudovirales phage TaxID=2100421 RepID=A0A6J7XB25_9CAUD|nr:hypothetical protein UFOVP740_12 [uncultured Caudovirales phage]